MNAVATLNGKLKYADCVEINYNMARTITIYDNAYNALKKRKKQDESFTDVILREFSEGNAGKILAVVRELKPDPELAKNIRQASRKHRRNFKIRRFDIK